ncbi:MAG: hypothetical protein AB8B80_05570 [Marinicellaceae bacterium]
MNKILVFIVLISISLTLNAEGWSLDLSKGPFDHSSSKIIEYQSKGGQTLIDILNDSTKDFSSFSLRVLCCSQLGSSKKINTDLARYFKEKIPEEFAKAILSSANLHNPALVPLQNNLTIAFKNSQFFKNIETQLAIRDLYVVEFHFEKFMMFDTNEPYLFNVDIWLRIKKKTN